MRGMVADMKAGMSLTRTAAREPEPDILRVRDPFTIVIFGASGDLSSRKLLPALAQLERAGHLPERYAIVGSSRTPMSDDAFRERVGKAMREGDAALAESAL